MQRLFWIPADPKAPTLDELIVKGKLIYDFGLENYQFSSFKQHMLDIKSALKNGDDTTSKRLNKIQGSARIVERNFQIISNLYKNDLINEQRPLTFYPNSKKQRLFIGSEEKNTVHNIVPFEFVGKKKLYYGLTATGTSDLNPMPFDPRYPMVGLHANALNTILDNKIIHEVPKAQIVFIILVIGVILSFGIPALSAAMGGLATGVIVGGYTWISFWLFQIIIFGSIWLALYLH